MESLLQKNPGINLIYTINEPAGFGGATALKAAGKDKDFSSSRSTAAARRSRTASSGRDRRDLAAVPAEDGRRWASRGRAAAKRRRRSPRGYTDTGVTLITAKPLTGVDSKDAAYGGENCWG